MQNIQWISEHLSVKPYTPKVIACYILLSIAIDKQLFFCDFDFYRFPISIDNKRLIISIVSDPRFDTHQRIGFSLEPLPLNRDHFLRLEWDQLFSDEFAVVIWRIRIKNFPNFGITDRKKCIQIGIILYYTEILAVKFFLSTICIALYVSISWLMHLIPALLPPVLYLRSDKRNGVVVIKLATTESWLKSSKPLQILDQSTTTIAKRSQVPFGYFIPLTMVRRKTSNVHSWTEFLSLIVNFHQIVWLDIPGLWLFFRPISKCVILVRLPDKTLFPPFVKHIQSNAPVWNKQGQINAPMCLLNTRKLMPQYIQK